MLRLKAVRFRNGLAEVNEFADLPAEFRQIAVLAAGEIVDCAHTYIVSRHNLCRQAAGLKSRAG